MDLGYDGSLFILAFDHRGSFKSKMFGVTAEPDEDERKRLDASKRVVWQGFQKAHVLGLPEGAGILVDEEMGAGVAREASDLGIPFALPVERSGQRAFDFEYGDDFGAHIEEFDPTFAKVLVRWNPADDPGLKEEQGGRLNLLSDWLHGHDRKFLFELLVPASESQLELVGGDTGAFDSRMRPMLMLETIAELRAMGIEPDVWKIEGVDETADCELLAALTMAGGRTAVRSVVLGRGADDAKVDHWLRSGAPVHGYAGFAIGRSIWWDAVSEWKNGALSDDDAADQIAANFRRFIDVYISAGT